MKHLKKYNESTSSVYYDIDIIESFLEGLEEIGFISRVIINLHHKYAPGQELERFQSLYDAKKYMDQNTSSIGTISYIISFNNFGSKDIKSIKKRKGSSEDYQNMKDLIDVFKSRISEFTNCVINNITISNDTKYHEQRSKGTFVIDEKFTITGQLNLTNIAKSRIDDKEV
jgi:hypothetical protein